MKHLKVVLLLTLVSLTTACATSPSNSANVVGVVVTSQKAPLKCVEKGSGGGGVVLGTVIGGLIGSKIGGGSGKKWMTGVGAITGGTAVVASNRTDRGKYDCYNQGYINQVQYINPLNNRMQYTTMNTKHRISQGTQISTKVKLY